MMTISRNMKLSRWSFLESNERLTATARSMIPNDVIIVIVFMALFLISYIIHYIKNMKKLAEIKEYFPVSCKFCLLLIDYCIIYAFTGSLFKKR